MFKRIPWKTNWPATVPPKRLRQAVYIGMGTNLGSSGQRLRRLELALRMLQRLGVARVIAVSSIYETPPWGMLQQDSFFNCVAAIETSLAPHSLLRILKHSESTLGRQSRVRWGPREIDLDILIMPNLHLDVPGIIIPHASMNERDFVKIPLAEVTGGYLP